MKSKVEVRLFAYFRDGRGKRLILEVETPQEAIDQLKIEKEEISILLVNGRDGIYNQCLKDGDVVSLFPPVGGG